MPPEAAYNLDLVATQHKALLKLAGILDSCQDPKELRLVAAAVARMKPVPVQEVPPNGPRTASAPTPPSTAPAPASAEKAASSAPSAAGRHHPLRCEELTLLAMLLPDVDPLRFVKKHTPEYWRDVIRRNLQEHARRPASAA